MADKKITALTDITTLAATDRIPVGRLGDNTAYYATPAEVKTYAGGNSINVKQYGVVGDGITDDYTAFVAAKAAAGNTDWLYVPPGTYYLSQSLVFSGTQVHLVGVKGSSILLFGGTNGIEVAGNYISGIIEGITLQTNSASGGRAIYFSNATYGASVTLRDIHVSVVDYTADRWAYGLWATFWESSAIYNLTMYAAATVGIHLEKDCNALQFYHVSMTGGIGATGPVVVSRGLEIDSTIAGSSQNPAFWGGVIQGYFHESCIYSDTSNAIFMGLHVENTYGSGTPADGADIYINAGGRTIVRDCWGGNVLVDGAARGVQVTGGYHPTIVFGILTNACLALGCKVDTLTVSGWYNESLANQSVSGYPLPDRLNASYTIELILGNGSYYTWVDATGDLRIKAGAPTSDTDGTVVGSQS